MINIIITVLVIYFFYYMWITINFDKDGSQKLKGKKRKLNAKVLKKKMPVEAEVFVKLYNVDIDKLNYKYFLQLIGLVVAIDLSLVIAVMDLIDKLWLKLLIGFIVMIVIVMISYVIMGKYFKKKGLVKNENNARNRKKME